MYSAWSKCRPCRWPLGATAPPRTPTDCHVYTHYTVVITFLYTKNLNRTFISVQQLVSRDVHTAVFTRVLLKLRQEAVVRESSAFSTHLTPKKHTKLTNCFLLAVFVSVLSLFI